MKCQDGPCFQKKCYENVVHRVLVSLKWRPGASCTKGAHTQKKFFFHVNDQMYHEQNDHVNVQCLTSWLVNALYTAVDSLATLRGDVGKLL